VSGSQRSGSQNFAVILLTLVSFANYVDRMVLNALSQPIKHEFGLSDTELGLLTGFAFVLLYAFAALPVAALADRTSKGLVLSCCLAVWSLATAACGITRSYVQLLTARFAVGIGESGCQPIGYALIADYFPSARRATPTGWFLVGNSLGITAGFMLGGWLGQAYGWRTAFVAVGLPGLLLAAILAVFTFRNPQPRAASPDPVQPRVLGGVPLLLGNGTFRWVLAANGIYSFMIFGPVAWLTPFFMRSHALSLRSAALWTGLAIGIGMAVGMVAGGAAADRLWRRSNAAPQLFCMAAALATGAAYLVVLNLADIRLVIAATFLASGIGALATPTNIVMVQNLCDPRLRAVAASLATLTISLVGVGLAPLAVGMMSDALTPAFGAEALRYSLMISLVVSLATAAVNYRLYRLLSR
jgi:predicted MFS family arabinose efflux permease